MEPQQISQNIGLVLAAVLLLAPVFGGAGLYLGAKAVSRPSGPVRSIIAAALALAAAPGSSLLFSLIGLPFISPLAFWVCPLIVIKYVVKVGWLQAFVLALLMGLAMVAYFILAAGVVGWGVIGHLRQMAPPMPPGMGVQAWLDLTAGRPV